MPTRSARAILASGGVAVALGVVVGLGVLGVRCVVAAGPIAPATRTAEPDPAPLVAAANAAPNPGPEPPPSAPRTRPVATSWTCIATVRSEPPGAQALWNEHPLGSTPVVLTRVPCGSALVTLKLPDYLSAEKWVSVENGKPKPVFVRLERPTGQVEIVSTPPGARVVVQGKSRGKAPVVVAAPGFTELHVEVTKPGFRVWSRRVVVEPPTTRVDVHLERLVAPARKEPR